MPIDALALAYQSAGSALLIFFEAALHGFFTLLPILSLIVLAIYRIPLFSKTLSIVLPCCISFPLGSAGVHFGMRDFMQALRFPYSGVHVCVR